MPHATRLRQQRLAGAAAVLVVVVAQAAGPQPTAAAHDRLVRSNPAADTVVATPIPEIRLTFSEPITPGFAAVTLSVDDGPAQPINLRVDGATLTAIPPEPAPPSAQRWTLAYRIVSSDGHPVVDQLRFTTQPATGAPSSTETAPTRSPATHLPPATTAPVAEPDRRWLVVVVDVVLLLVVAAVLRAGRRPRQREDIDP